MMDDAIDELETDDESFRPRPPPPTGLGWPIACTLQCVLWVFIRPFFVNPYNATAESEGRGVDALYRAANGIGEIFGPVFAIAMAATLALHCVFAERARKRALLAAFSAAPLLTELAFGEKRIVELWVWGCLCSAVTISALLTHMRSD